MNNTLARTLFWTPRILGILFALFISIFAFDVFAEGSSLGEILVALAMHLVPTALVVIALAIAWRWERIGAILFASLGLCYIVLAWGDSVWLAYLLISGPLFLVAALFLGDWLYRRNV